MKLKYLSFAAMLAVAVTGCAVGPNYQRPAASAPTHWNEPLAGGETNSPARLTAWWKDFHDAELDSLIDRAVQSNLDLQIAQARVREARAQYGIAVANFLPTVDAS
ncbi:MAG: TolC family protein, partial [Verrucomicrobia bacterium]|nr:TolC family protein [Verrucomicrobiota bacterium]